MVVVTTLLLIASAVAFSFGTSNVSNVSADPSAPEEGTPSYTEWMAALSPSDSSKVYTFQEVRDNPPGNLCSLTHLYDDFTAGSQRQTAYAGYTYFSVDSVGEFTLFSKLVNEDKFDFSGKVVFLLSSLDFGGSTITSIGAHFGSGVDSTDNTWFAGMFCGCGNSIKNVNVDPFIKDTLVSNSGGLFGMIKSNGKDVGIYDLTLSGVHTRASAVSGILAGYVYSNQNVTVEVINCKIADSDVKAYPYWNRDTFESRSTNIGTDDKTSLNNGVICAGSIGYVSAKTMYLENFTVIGTSGSSTVVFDYDSTNSTLSDYSYFIGGLVGYYSGSTNYALSFVDSSFSGSINASLKEKASSGTNGMSIGGIIGKVYRAKLLFSYNSSLESTVYVDAESSTAVGGGLYLGGLYGTCSTVTISGSSVLTGTPIINILGSKVYWNNNIWIGGLIGCNNEGPSSMQLTHSGKVVFESILCEGYAAYVGGVVGSSSKIVGGTNLGDITVSNVDCKTLYLGGFAGMAGSGITYAKNSNSDSVVLSGCRVAGDSYIGGCVGYSSSTSQYSEDCVNYAEVELNDLKCSKNLYFGGVIGYAYLFKDSSNYGNLTLSDISCTSAYFGGVLGILKKNATSSISSISNHGTLNIFYLTTSENNTAIGGCIGNGEDGTYSDVFSTGCIKIDGIYSTQSMRIGGVIGYLNTSKTASNVYCSNPDSDAVVLTASNVNILSGAGGYYLYIGGVFGIISGSNTLSGCSTTSNKIVVDNCSSPREVHIGGVAGQISKKIDDSVESKLSLDVSDCSYMSIYLGGVYGKATVDISNATYGGILSTSDVSTTSEYEVGGVVGRCELNASNLLNQGELNVGLNTTSYAYVGGVIGRANSTSSAVVGCVNEGDVYFDINKCGRLYAGGIVGYLKSKMSLSHNEGCLNLTNTLSSNNIILALGGLTGGLESNMLKCWNTGDISINSTHREISLGLFSGYVVKDKGSVTSCYSTSVPLIGGDRSTSLFMFGCGDKTDYNPDVANSYCTDGMRAIYTYGSDKYNNIKDKYVSASIILDGCDEFNSFSNIWYADTSCIINDGFPCFFESDSEKYRSSVYVYDFTGIRSDAVLYFKETESSTPVYLEYDSATGAYVFESDLEGLAHGYLVLELDGVTTELLSGQIPSVFIWRHHVDLTISFDSNPSDGITSSYFEIYLQGTFDEFNGIVEYNWGPVPSMFGQNVWVAVKNESLELNSYRLTFYYRVGSVEYRGIIEGKISLGGST